jgi:hypothetical protein
LSLGLALWVALCFTPVPLAAQAAQPAANQAAEVADASSNPDAVAQGTDESESSEVEVEPAATETDYDASKASADEAAQTLGPPPKLVFEQTSLDLGEVNEGEPAKFKFTFSNEGEGELRIIQVHKTCGCTRAEPSKKEIQPGETAYIEGELDTTNRPGNQRKTIRVMTNDPKTPQETLTIAVKVKQEVEINPRHISFRSLDLNETGTQELKIVNHTEQPLQITGIEVNPEDKVKAKLVSPVSEDNPNQSAAVVGPDTPILIEVSSVPSPEVGSFAGVITLDTTNPHKRKVQVHVSGRVTGDLEVYPMGLWFGALQESSPTTRTATLSSKSGIPFKIKKIDPNGVPVHVSYEPLENKEGFRLQVGIDTTTDQDRISGRILVETTHPKQPEVEIPVTAFFRRPVVKQ